MTIYLCSRDLWNGNEVYAMTPTETPEPEEEEQPEEKPEEEPEEEVPA